MKCTPTMRSSCPRTDGAAFSGSNKRAGWGIANFRSARERAMDIQRIELHFLIDRSEVSCNFVHAGLKSCFYLRGFPSCSKTIIPVLKKIIVCKSQKEAGQKGWYPRIAQLKLKRQTFLPPFLYPLFVAISFLLLASRALLVDLLQQICCKVICRTPQFVLELALNFILERWETFALFGFGAN